VPGITNSLSFSRTSWLIAGRVQDGPLVYIFNQFGISWVSWDVPQSFDRPHMYFSPRNIRERHFCTIPQGLTVDEPIIPGKWIPSSSLLHTWPLDRCARKCVWRRQKAELTAVGIARDSCHENFDLHEERLIQVTRTVAEQDQVDIRLELASRKPLGPLAEVGTPSIQRSVGQINPIPVFRAQLFELIEFFFFFFSLSEGNWVCKNLVRNLPCHVTNSTFRGKIF